MRSNEVKQRTKQFGKFGQLLLKRYSHNLVTNQASDIAAERLGRYLHAARVTAGLAPSELASQAHLPLAVVLALETGLIPAQEIQTGWLQRLATALAEDVDDLQLILGPQGPKRHSWAWLEVFRPRPGYTALQPNHLGPLLLPKTRLPIRSIYTTGLAMFTVCVMMIAFWAYVPGQFEAVPTKTQGSTGFLSQIEPAQRLGLITADSVFRNRVWTPDMRFWQFRSKAPLRITGIDFDIKPPIGLPSLGHVGIPETPERLNMLQAERQLNITALIQPAYTPISIEAYCCGVQP